MSFTQETFASIGAQSTDAPTVYSYRTSDTNLTVTAAGYFTPKQYQLNEGDIIFCFINTGHLFLEVTADTSSASIIDIEASTIPNTYIIQTKSDFPVQATGEMLQPMGAYDIKGSIDLLGDTLAFNGGSVLIGDTATLSRITTASANPTITFKAGGFAACGIHGKVGFGVHNTGGGAAVRVQDTTTICELENLLTSAAGNALEVNDSNFIINGWTILNSVNGLVMTGTLNTGPIINDFNPIGLSGRGIYINGSIASGALRINRAIIGSFSSPMELSGVEVASGWTIQGMSFSGDAVSNTGNGIKIAGAVAGGISLDKTNILSKTNDAMDITGGRFSSFIANSAGITAIASGKYGLKGESGSVNITTGKGIVSASFISGVGGALSGISKGDEKWSFDKAGPAIVDSTNVGGYTLSAASNTTFTYQGFDGVVTAYATNGAGGTTVTSAGHPLINTEPASITGTVAYNGLFAVFNVVAGVSFDIARAFVTNEATGDWQSGWTKIAGTTVAIDIIERFTMSANNEVRSDDAKTLPMTFTAVIAGERATATARVIQFALFVDDSGGTFRKVDGYASFEATNRINSTTLRVPFNVAPLAKSSVYCRNMEGTELFTTDAMSVDIKA